MSAVITFSSCFYILKSKFDANQYCAWAENFIGTANNFNLVIYTDEYSSKFINTRNKPKPSSRSTRFSSTKHPCYN